jgi:hypothetical protein
MSSRAKFALRVAVSCSLIVLIATQLDTRPIGDALARIDPRAVGLATLVYAVVVAAFSAFRWMIVCRALGLRMPVRQSIELVYIGFFFGQLLPAGIGGDAMRAWRTRALGADWEVTVHCVLLDRLLALAATVVIVVLGWSMIATALRDPAALAAIAAMAAFTTVAFALLLGGDKVLPSAKSIWRERLARLSVHARLLLLTRYSFPALAASVLVHFSASLVVWLIARGLAIEIPLSTTCVLVPLVLLAAMVPVSIGGWGVREGAMVALFGLAGVAQGPAFALSVVFGVVSLAAGLPGVLLWLRDPVRE